MADRINLAEIRLGKAVHEIIGDRLADVIRHHKDPLVKEGKPSTITVKIQVLPENDGIQLATNVTSSVALAPRKQFSAVMYGGLNKDGEAEVTDYDPGQLALPMGEKQRSEF